MTSSGAVTLPTLRLTGTGSEVAAPPYLNFVEATIYIARQVSAEVRIARSAEATVEITRSVDATARIARTHSEGALI